MADQTPTPAAEWAQPFIEYGTEVLPSGRVCRIRLFNPTDELLAGTLPNILLDWVVFAKPWGITNDDPPATVAAHYEGLVNLAARILVDPVLVIRGDDEPPADPAKGEIGPGVLTPEDLYHLRAVGMWSRLPEVQDAPFSDPADEARGAGAPLASDAADAPE